mmetsp:Transcript_8873/g.37248  ORF Transcript_8873/g.37248 Transcript_8873/m.37248 type:complete len:208 (+) Transcript_8873:379-1002(+)
MPIRGEPGRPARPPDAQLGLRFGVRVDGAQGAGESGGRRPESSASPARARRATRRFADAAADGQNYERVDHRPRAPFGVVRAVRRGVLHGHPRRQPRVFHRDLLPRLHRGRRVARTSAVRKRGGERRARREAERLRPEPQTMGGVERVDPRRARGQKSARVERKRFRRTKRDERRRVSTRLRRRLRDGRNKDEDAIRGRDPRPGVRL